MPFYILLSLMTRSTNKWLTLLYLKLTSTLIVMKTLATIKLTTVITKLAFSSATNMLTITLNIIFSLVLATTLITF